MSKSYTLIKEQFMEEQNALGSLWIHDKTGAKLMTMSCEDDNKVFSIGFRTPSIDSTGAAHIVEHSVLSGSRKYHTKEPFMDMVKGSMQTFLNAMTYPDRTVYPVASRHDKDFHNLMDVYLDAVFYPAMDQNPYIFAQEGWHEELDNMDEPLTIRGVVYNEMRGAYSSPDAQINDTVNKYLRKGTNYEFSSAGDPYEIPNLSYEKFVEFHKKHYHPSNSYIFLYGNMDMEKTMDYLDKEYLSNFDKINPNTSIALETITNSPKEIIYEKYGLSEEDVPANKSYLTYNLLVGDGGDPMDNFMRSLMSLILIDSESSKLRKLILDEGICEDIYTLASPGRTLDFSIIAKNAKSEDVNRFVELIENECIKLVKEGIPKDLLKSRIQKISFDLREGSGYPTKGIIYSLSAIGYLTYDKDPFSMLNYEPILKQLEDGLDNGLYERWIEEKILNNPSKLIMVLDGDPGLFTEKDRKLAQALKERKNSLSTEALEEIISNTNLLAKMQLTEDSEEAKATIPTLHIEDLNSSLPDIPIFEKEIDGVPIYIAPQPTQGVIYGQWLFDLTSLSEEELPYAGLLGDLLLRMDTKTRDYGSLNDLIFFKTGGINISTYVINHHTDPQKYKAYLSVEGKCLADSFEDMLELMDEIMYETCFDDIKRLGQLISITRSKDEEDIIPSGHKVSMDRVASQFLNGDKFDEIISGTDYFLTLKKWEKLEDITPISTAVKAVAKKLFLKENASFHITAVESDISNCMDSIKNHLPPTGNEAQNMLQWKFSPINEGLLTSANVNYVSQGFLLPKFEFTGTHAVLSQLLSDDYLHNRIRARGGAYGAGISIARTGLIRTYSYRDPNILETIEVYNGIADYLRNIELSYEDVERIIIGTANGYNPPLTPYMAGNLALTRHLNGLTVERLERELQEVLSTNPNDLRACANDIDIAMKNSIKCVLGNGTLISSQKQIFDKIIDLGI
ncbi:MAG: insulinase family protein [Tissierellia bacterium]|nr:insulinase family protein [Tissierellia bacterium]